MRNLRELKYILLYIFIYRCAVLLFRNFKQFFSIHNSIITIAENEKKNLWLNCYNSHHFDKNKILILHLLKNQIPPNFSSKNKMLKQSLAQFLFHFHFYLQTKKRLNKQNRPSRLILACLFLISISLKMCLVCNYNVILLWKSAIIMQFESSERNK